jgi:hypothetical protein
MAAWRRAIELSLGDSDTAKLRSIAQSRERNRRAGSSGRGYCWPIGKTHRFLRSVGRSDAEKMAEVLCVYRQVKILNQAAAVSKAKKRPSGAVAIISYNEKPGIQAIATTAPDLPPEPGVHATFAREREYTRHPRPASGRGLNRSRGRALRHAACGMGNTIAGRGVLS